MRKIFKGYIPKLLELFRICEDLENKEALKTLYEIFKSIWMLNQGDIYEILFKNEHIFVCILIHFLNFFEIYHCPEGVSTLNRNLGRGRCDGVRSF